MASSPKDIMPRRLFERLFRSGPELAPTGAHDIFGMRKLKLPSAKSADQDGKPIVQRRPEKEEV